MNKDLPLRQEVIELPGTVIVTAHHHKEYNQHEEEPPRDPVHDGGGDGDGHRVVSHGVE